MNNTSIAAEVSALSDLSTSELWQRYDNYFSRRPTGTNREHLISRLAYKIQEEAFGALPQTVRDRLVSIGARRSKIRIKARDEEYVLAPGTVLIRQFDDHEHRVTVMPSGEFEYEGKHFKSLSAAAKHIAGSPWSGPVFFGLKK